MIIRTCIHCGASFEVLPYVVRNGNGKYCSRTCAGVVGSRLSGLKNAQDAKLRRKNVRQPEGFRLIALNKDLTTKVDIEDFEYLSTYNWSISSTGYARRVYRSSGRSVQVRLHRAVLEQKLGRKLDSHELVDHINHDKLDNRRSNLRLATVHQNNYNTGRKRNDSSRYTGVRKINNRWTARVKRDGVVYLLGSFTDEDTASWMRDQWAIALHEEFARPNFDYHEVPRQDKSAVLPNPVKWDSPHLDSEVSHA